jgi:serine/threonine protein kinase
MEPMSAEWGAPTMNTLFQSILSDEPRLVPGVFRGSDEALDFLRKVLVKNPDQRLSATKCLDHAFIAQNEAKGCVKREVLYGYWQIDWLLLLFVCLIQHTT